MVDTHLLNDQQDHPHTEIHLGQHDRYKVGVDQALFDVRGKYKQPEVGGQNGNTGDGRRMAQDGDGTQAEPNGGLRHQEKPTLPTTVLGGDEKGQEEDDDQPAHPQDMVGHVGLVRQQHPNAKACRCEREHRIFAQLEREGEGENARIEQGQAGDEKRHGCEHERHQFGPRNTAYHQVRRRERQCQEHQLRKRIPRLCSVRSNGHQRAHHPEGDGHSPQTGFAETKRMNGLTQPIFMMHKGCCHGRVCSRYHAQEKEKRKVVFYGQQREGKHGPIVGEGVDAHPQVRH